MGKWAFLTLMTWNCRTIDAIRIRMSMALPVSKTISKSFAIWAVAKARAEFRNRHRADKKSDKTKHQQEKGPILRTLFFSAN